MYGQYFPVEIWYELNYVSTLKNECQLILSDAQGQSVPIRIQGVIPNC